MAAPAAGNVNWSKVPFAAIETSGLGDPAWEQHLLAAFDRYLDAVVALGFTAVTIDDLAHLVVHSWYPAALRQQLILWRRLYAEIFRRIRQRGLGVYVTSDYCFFNPAIDAYLRRTGTAAADFFAATLAAALADWPEIDGLVLRIGESDGVDVEGAFVSRITVRYAAEARRLLTVLLPLLEQCGKTLIFRTWTLGAYPIGDLIWSQRTWDAVFAGINSPALIVSLKYGEADFFRFLPLNPLFFHGPQPKLLELQCRREYEGMGEYPAFVGWLYDRYLRELHAGGARLAGVFAIQGGGWGPFRQMPFTGMGAIWNELNMATVAGLAQGWSVEEAVHRFCQARGVSDVPAFLTLLRLADAAVEEGLYIREFAERPLYFRRVRIPPLLWVFWHHVSTGGLIALVHRVLVHDPASAVADGHRAVRHVEQMIELARRLGLDTAPLRFQLDTFHLLAWQREVLLGVATPATHARIAELLPRYRARYSQGYCFDAPPSPVQASRPLALVIRGLLRSRQRYRWSDRVQLNQPLSRLMAGAARRLSGWLPRFAGQQGMSPESLLR